jgi:hypothetical protein
VRATARSRGSPLRHVLFMFRFELIGWDGEGLVWLYRAKLKMPGTPQSGWGPGGRGALRCCHAVAAIARFRRCVGRIWSNERRHDGATADIPPYPAIASLRSSGGDAGCG